MYIIDRLSILSDDEIDAFIETIDEIPRREYEDLNAETLIICHRGREIIILWPAIGKICNYGFTMYLAQWTTLRGEKQEIKRNGAVEYIHYEEVK